MATVDDSQSALNLPAFDCQLSRGDDGMVRIYDRLRGKHVALTPEEWVRQHFVNYLISELGFPAGLMANEVSLNLNGCHRRCDTLIYSRQRRPLAVVEYKAPEVNVTQKVFDQIARYNSVFGAPYLIVSNGMSHYCCRYDASCSKYTFLPGIPAYEEMCRTSL